MADGQVLASPKAKIPDHQKKRNKRNKKAQDKNEMKNVTNWIEILGKSINKAGAEHLTLQQERDMVVKLLNMMREVDKMVHLNKGTQNATDIQISVEDSESDLENIRETSPTELKRKRSGLFNSNTPLKLPKTSANFATKTPVKHQFFDNNTMIRLIQCHPSPSLPMRKIEYIRINYQQLSRSSDFLRVIIQYKLNGTIEDNDDRIVHIPESGATKKDVVGKDIMIYVDELLKSGLAEEQTGFGEVMRLTLNNIWRGLRIFETWALRHRVECEQTQVHERASTVVAQFLGGDAEFLKALRNHFFGLGSLPANGGSVQIRPPNWNDIDNFVHISPRSKYNIRIRGLETARKGTSSSCKLLKQIHRHH